MLCKIFIKNPYSKQQNTLVDLTVEHEMLKQDNDQLMASYEVERRKRKESEQELVENEYINESLSEEVRLKMEEQEMLKMDNGQLMASFEMERRKRRESEQQLMENEYINEGLSTEVRLKMENYESENRHLVLKCKNYADES